MTRRVRVPHGTHLGDGKGTRVFRVFNPRWWQLHLWLWWLLAVVIPGRFRRRTDGPNMDGRRAGARATGMATFYDEDGEWQLRVIETDVDLPWVPRDEEAQRGER